MKYRNFLLVFCFSFTCLMFSNCGKDTQTGDCTESASQYLNTLESKNLAEADHFKMDSSKEDCENYRAALITHIEICEILNDCNLGIDYTDEIIRLDENLENLDCN